MSTGNNNNAYINAMQGNGVSSFAFRKSSKNQKAFTEHPEIRKLLEILGGHIDKNVAYLTCDAGFESHEYNKLPSAMKLGAPMKFWSINIFRIMSIGLIDVSAGRFPGVSVKMLNSDGEMKEITVAYGDLVSYDPNSTERQLLAAVENAKNEGKSIFQKMFSIPEDAMQVAQAYNRIENDSVKQAIQRYTDPKGGSLTAHTYMMREQELRFSQDFEDHGEYNE